MLKFPKKPKDTWCQVKIKRGDREYIKFLYHVQNWTPKQIAHLYKVSNSTIYYIFNKESYRRKLDDNYEKKETKRRTNPQYRALVIKTQTKYIKEREKIDPLLRAYNLERNLIGSRARRFISKL